MKTPFPAYLIERHAAPYWSVHARRCRVLDFDNASQTARVEVGTALSSIRGLTITVPFSQLARTRERALALVGEGLAALFAEESSEAAGKSAAIETAGAGHAAPAASAQLPLTA